MAGFSRRHHRVDVVASALAFALICLAGSAFAAGDRGAPARAMPPTAAALATETGRVSDLIAAERAGSRRAAGSSGGVGRDTGGGGGKPLPRNRIVALYGAPQLTSTIIGRKKTPRAAARKLRRQARRWRGPKRARVIKAFDLVATIATADPGPSGKYRSRQPGSVIRAYLQEAKGPLDGRLLLDVQPGRSSFLNEAKALRPYLKRNRVDLALDPEWNVGRRGVPGKTPGSVGARAINRVSGWLQRLAKRRDLRPKVLVVHQFTRDSVRRRGLIKNRPRVQVVLAFDGSGSPRAKADGYHALRRPGLVDGFALFYRLDKPLISPKRVLGSLDPNPAYVYYQ